jgi:hypothetical protein
MGAERERERNMKDDSNGWNLGRSESVCVRERGGGRKRVRESKGKKERERMKKYI